MGRRVRSGPPTGLVSDGFRRLGLAVADHLLILGLLSNTGWAAPAARVMIVDRVSELPALLRSWGGA